MKATVIEATGGRGADIVIEHVGEATWRTSQDVASQGGRIVVCGATARTRRPRCTDLVEGALDPRLVHGDEDFEAAELVKSGRAKVVVDSTFPLAETAPHTSG